MSTLKCLTSLSISLTLVLSLFSQNSYAQLTELKDFNDNPGNLTASYFSPLIANPDIVVLLHGCAQEGKELARQSGLLGLARQHNFALLIPQQSLENNIKGCFNWYSASDYAKETGENLSIKNMIVALKKQLVGQNIYILGLSAGGAMASSLLVNYPELFTAGAIVAGIPFPCADGLITAISCMKNGPSQTADELTLLVEKLNPNQKVWPKLSIWTGDNDAIVNPLNAITLADHWATLLGVTLIPQIKTKAGYTRKSWGDKQEKVQVELMTIANVGHGIMVNPKEVNGGEAANYLLESPISTAKHIVVFWHLASTKNNVH
jgi:poly(hydroxyalkanoate) depolymerase family esterase